MSLACTLIHSPPLLILDEPTVGTDPVLRHNIWTHLISLCKAGHTIIVTTHYIDEARNARSVAFMRNGIILAEENPEVLLNKYCLTNLEDVFLKLCLSSVDSKDNFVSISVDNNHCYDNAVIYGLDPENEEQGGMSSQNESTYLKKNSSIEMKRKAEEVDITIMNDSNYDKQVVTFDGNNNSLVLIRDSAFTDKCAALLHKNYKRITRKWGHLFFEVIISSVMFLILFLSIGDGPTNLNLAVFDQEAENNVTNRWGYLYIDTIEKGRFNYHYFKSLEEAVDSVRRGENHAALHINERFTKALILRFLYSSETNVQTLKESQIHVFIDRSNQIIGLQLERYLYIGMIHFIQLVAKKADIQPESVNIPLVFEEPIYGDINESLREFMVPGAYIILIFFTSATITAHMIIDEKKDGLLERSLVAGVTASDFLVSQLITQFFIQCFQLMFLLVIPYYFLDKQIFGSLILFLAMLFSQGFCGVGLGLVVSVLFTDIIIAGLLLLFLFITAIVTSGIVWPIENMPIFLQSTCKLFPMTMPVQSLRSIVYRHWNIEYFEVYFGFVVSYVWIAIFIIITLILLKKHL